MGVGQGLLEPGGGFGSVAIQRFERSHRSYRKNVALSFHNLKYHINELPKVRSKSIRIVVLASTTVCLDGTRLIYATKTINTDIGIIITLAMIGISVH
jgi:hypothetical protein